MSEYLVGTDLAPGGTSPVPAPADRLRVISADWFPGTAEAVGQVRRFVAGTLGKDCLGLSDAVLLASEIATNAVCHTASGGPGGWLDVTVSVDGSTVRVTVADRGGISEPRVRPGGGGAEATGGRGLALVDALAARWGYTGDRNGRMVWFELGPETGK